MRPTATIRAGRQESGGHRHDRVRLVAGGLSWWAAGRCQPTRPSPAPISTPLGPPTNRPATIPQGAGSNDKNPATGKGREGLGRSRGGLTTKIHLVADRRCRPVTRLTSPGQHGDSPRFIPLMESIRIPRRGRGRPRKRPGRAMGDKAYSSKVNRAYLRRHGIQAVIPVKEDQKANRLKRGSAGGRPPNFDAEWYKERNTVERLLQQAAAVPGGGHALR
jgi:hypothetical protein